MLNTRTNRDRIERELRESQEHVCILEDQELLGRYFRKPGNLPVQTHICFSRREDSPAIYVLVDQDLEYTGNDPEIRDAFARNSMGGWRQLFIPNDGDVGETLELTGNVLGLSGRPPSFQTEDEIPRLVVEDEDRSALEEPNGRKEDKDFSTDLVHLARQNKLPRLMGREMELEAVMRILSKRSKNGVVLIGEAGVGKTAIVEGLAQLVADDNVPASLSGIKIIQINMSLLPAGASMFGEFEGRMKSIIQRAKQDHQTVLFLDEVHTICSHNSDASQMLKTDLARGTIRVIGATTFKEYRQIEQDAALARRFQKVIVREPTQEQTLEMLRGIKRDYEDHHNVTIPDDTLEEIVRLSVGYVKDRFLPDKAIDLMDEAASKLGLLSIKDKQVQESSAGYSLDERIREAIASRDYTEATRLYSLKGSSKEAQP